MQRLRYSKYLKVIIILLDIVVIAGIFVYFFKQKNPIVTEDALEQNLLSILLLSLFWILLGSRTKLYNVSRNLTYTQYLERYFGHMIIFLFGIILLGKVSTHDFI